VASLVTLDRAAVGLAAVVGHLGISSKRLGSREATAKESGVARKSWK